VVQDPERRSHRHHSNWLPGLAAGAVPALAARAAQSGVGVYPLAPYYVHPRVGRASCSGYAGLNEREIRAGVSLLAGVVRAFEKNRPS